MIVAGMIVGLVVIIIIYVAINKLNYYPQLKVHIDITSKRNMNDANTCLNFYFNNYGFQEIIEHLNVIQKWKQYKFISCKGRPKKILVLKKRLERNCRKAFKFIVYRTQTKYRQVNYVRTAYKDDVTYFNFCLSDTEVAQSINYQIPSLEVTANKC